jgi:hypothetical protein
MSKKKKKKKKKINVFSPLPHHFLLILFSISIKGNQHHPKSLQQFLFQVLLLLVVVVVVVMAYEIVKFDHLVNQVSRFICRVN